MTRRNYRFGLVGLFVLLHLSILWALWLPFSWHLVALALGTYSIRMWAVTAGYHRYFSHRSYRLGRPAQFLLAFVAQTSGQKGVLWWVAQHRHHHRHSDGALDVHSPKRGFWWSHVGWILSNEFDGYDAKTVGDWAKFPELVLLDRLHWLPPTLFAAAVAAAFGWQGLIWGFLISTVLLYHCTFAINSVAHLAGTRRFNTADGSRNNWLLAILTFGEGWHNNHHYCMTSCRQGYRWWELDLTYLGIRLLEFCGVASGLRPFRGRQPQSR